MIAFVSHGSLGILQVALVFDDANVGEQSPYTGVPSMKPLQRFNSGV